MKTKTNPVKPKIETVGPIPESVDEEIPAGVRLSYVDAYVHQRNQLQCADLILLERIGELRERRKKINLQLDTLNRRRPDQQPDESMPLISELNADTPAGKATVEINLDSGKESALAILGVARERLTDSEFDVFIADFENIIGCYD